MVNNLPTFQDIGESLKVRNDCVTLVVAVVVNKFFNKLVNGKGVNHVEKCWLF